MDVVPLTSKIAEPSESDRCLTRPVTFTRHDLHNLELKVALACPQKPQSVWVDVYLFLPRSFHVDTWSKSDLRHDFHSRLRLGIQQPVARQESQVRQLYGRVRDLVFAISSHPHQSMFDDLFQQTRELGAVLGELLKYESRRLRSELLAATARSHLAPDPEKIVLALHDSLLKLDRLVQQCEDLHELPGAADVPVLRLFRQYIHNLYTDFLGKLTLDYQSIVPSSTLHEAWALLGESLNKLKLHEARSFQFFSNQDGASDSEYDELRLLRLSQIKKFFQAQMFIDVQRKDTIRRFSEPAAAGAAAFAAMWAGAFEYFSQPKMHAVGLQGTMVICIGVALYVLKDRLKDLFRAQFTQRLAAILPEAEQVLVADNKRIGKVREWFRMARANELPKEIADARRKADLSEAEKHLPEDALHFRQEFELEPMATSYGEFEKSIQQTIRINIDRFLKRLDDPYKNIGLFDGEGEIKLIRSHRVYHLHALINIRRADDQLMQGLYRVVVDKQGVSRVHTVCP